jgi:hypothetical protein
MIISMPTTARLQQRYDHRLRNLVQRTGDVTVATDLGVPRSTARGWLGTTPTVMVGLDVVVSEKSIALKTRGYILICFGAFPGYILHGAVRAPAPPEKPR